MGIKRKKKTQFQLQKERRDQAILAVYESAPSDTPYKLRQLAELFDCSIATIWNALHGRSDGKKVV